MTCRLIAWLPLVLLGACERPEIWVPASAGTILKIQAAVTGYLDAARARDGKKAADHVTASTLAAHEALRLLALHASRRELEDRSTVDRVRILLMRAKYSVQELEQLAGRMFEQFVADDLANAPERGPAKFEDFEEAPNEARAVFVGEKKSDAPRVKFKKEHGTWRVDLESLNSDIEPLFDAMLARLGGSRDEATVKMVAELLGKPVDEAILTPPQPR